MIRLLLGLVVVAGALVPAGCASDDNDIEAARSSSPSANEEPDGNEETDGGETENGDEPDGDERPRPSSPEAPEPVPSPSSSGGNQEPAPASPTSPTSPDAPVTSVPASGSPGPEQSEAAPEKQHEQSTEPASSFDNVIVDLAVEREHESELSAEERDEQRRKIEVAQDEVVAELGSHGRLLRRLTATAQMSVAVDGKGREILDAHELVARVHEDDPVPSN